MATETSNGHSETTSRVCSPPKVAQMMINLAGPDRHKILLDPFCGSGTILQEAALLNFQKIYGSDQNSQAVKDSQVNLDWLRKNFGIKTDITVGKMNVKNLSQNWLIIPLTWLSPNCLWVRPDKYKNSLNWNIWSDWKWTGKIYIWKLSANSKKSCQKTAKWFLSFRFLIFVRKKSIV